MNGIRVTIMGLGLHGGGVESALFCLKKGAEVTVTDLKEEAELRSSLERLKNYPVRFVLGRHEQDDFISTDLIIKNPGVPQDSPFLITARKHNIPVETDISLFLHYVDNPVIAVTGSKGKSTTATAIHFVLERVSPGSKLGGNITISPLVFVNTLPPGVPVVLELSSWQLADLAHKNVLTPEVSLITNIFPDHLNWYGNMERYISDKTIIYKNQKKSDFSIFNYDCPYVTRFEKETPATPCYFSKKPLPPQYNGAWLKAGKGYVRFRDSYDQILEDKVKLPGFHNRMNLLSAGLALYLYGMNPEIIRSFLSQFTGIEHRFELFLQYNNVDYYNDSAATIPQATVAAIRTLPEPVHLITGGTDKSIDFAPLLNVVTKCEKIYLLKGTGTEKIVRLFNQKGVQYEGIYLGVNDVVDQVIINTYPGVSVLFSPGCASFGMFLNEFDRGQKFKAYVNQKLGAITG